MAPARGAWPTWLGRAPLALAVLGSVVAFVPGGHDIESTFAAGKALVVAGACLLGVAGASFSRRSPVRFHADALDLAALGCLVVAGASVGAGGSPVRFALEPVLTLGVTLGLFLLTRRQAADPNTRAWLTGVCIFGAAVVGAAALTEAMGLVLFAGVPRRPVSLLGNRNAVGVYVAIVLPLAVGWACRDRRPRALACVVLLACVLVSTRCRAAWLGAMAASLLGLIAILRARRRSWLRPLAALAVGLGLGALPWPGLHWEPSASVAGTAGRLVDWHRGSGKGRVDEMWVAARALRGRPLLGVGPRGWGDARSRFGHTGADRHAPSGIGSEAPQSDAVRLAAETGLLGLGSVALLLGLVVLQLWGARRTDPLLFPLLAALVAAGPAFLLDAPMARAETAALLSVLAGLGAPHAAAWSAPPGAGAGPAGLRAWPRGLSRGLAVALVAVAALSAAARLVAARWSGPGATVEELARADALAPTARTRARIASSLAGRWAPAQVAAEHALELQPHSWGLLVYASQCAEASGHLSRSAELYARALEVEPHLEALRRARRAVPAAAVSTRVAAAGAPGLLHPRPGRSPGPVRERSAHRR